MFTRVFCFFQATRKNYFVSILLSLHTMSKDQKKDKSRKRKEEQVEVKDDEIKSVIDATSGLKLDDKTCKDQEEWLGALYAKSKDHFFVVIEVGQLGSLLWTTVINQGIDSKEVEFEPLALTDDCEMVSIYAVTMKHYGQVCAWTTEMQLGLIPWTDKSVRERVLKLGRVAPSLHARHYFLDSMITDRMAVETIRKRERIRAKLVTVDPKTKKLSFTKSTSATSPSASSSSSSVPKT